MPLTIGTRYSREQIREAVGGGDLQSYLPHSHGRVLCGCFDPALNARAPYEIDVGDLPNVIRYAEALMQQASEIPVFLKHGTGEWEYLGQFLPVRYSTEKEDLYPKKSRRPDAVAVLYLAQTGTENPDVTDDSSVTATAASEGGRNLVEHLRQERSRSLVDAKRRTFRKANGMLKCEACGVSETDLPAKIGEGCFEVHHIAPLGQRTGPIVTRIDDLALLCANCHRMIHRSIPMFSVSELREVIGRRVAV